MTHPPPGRWADCEPFVTDLLARQYVRWEDDGKLHLCMSLGIYLYMYELWRDGHERGKCEGCKDSG